jgi:hypothetical protein
VDPPGQDALTDEERAWIERDHAAAMAAELGHR